MICVAQKAKFFVVWRLDNKVGASRIYLGVISHFTEAHRAHCHHHPVASRLWHLPVLSLLAQLGILSERRAGDNSADRRDLVAAPRDLAAVLQLHALP
jgi:hypothetical protein